MADRCDTCGASDHDHCVSAKSTTMAELGELAEKQRERNEFVDTMRRTAATMDGIDNSWNLLHIASQVMAALASRNHDVINNRHVAETVAKESLTYADALLKEFRKSQGDDYGD